MIHSKWTMRLYVISVKMTGSKNSISEFQTNQFVSLFHARVMLINSLFTNQCFFDAEFWNKNSQFAIPWKQCLDLRASPFLLSIIKEESFAKMVTFFHKTNTDTSLDWNVKKILKFLAVIKFIRKQNIRISLVLISIECFSRIFFFKFCCQVFQRVSSR